MHRSFEELVSKDKYVFVATADVAYGDGWFINLTSYTRTPEPANKDVILIYTMGITADSTIDSSLYDPSMTYATHQLLIKKGGGKISMWLWEKGKGNQFRRLFEREFRKHKKEIMKSVRHTILPKEKIRSVINPQIVLHWRSR